jgi:hypothetical protein
MKYRIVRRDKLNWQLEEWMPGGKAGPKGDIGSAKWKRLESYHSNIEQAALALLDHAAGDAMLSWEAQSIQQAFEVAKRAVLDALDRLPVGTQ